MVFREKKIVKIILSIFVKDYDCVKRNFIGKF